jgi:hypothetical protein
LPVICLKCLNIETRDLWYRVCTNSSVTHGFPSHETFPQYTQRL